MRGGNMYTRDGGSAPAPAPMDTNRGATITGISYDSIGTGRKAKETVSGGIRGCIKNRIVSVMLDAIDDPHKILICDHTAAQLISTCLRMHELLEHGVVLVEDVLIPRQPIVTSNALYFIAPTEESVQAVMQDWQGRRPYKAAHIFFTSSATDRMIETIAGNPNLVENTQTVKDMMLDFDVPESLFFHMGLPADIPKLFPPEIALSGARENILGQISSKLISVFLTIGKGVPSIRYQASSRLSQKVARNFFDDIAKLSKDVPELKIGSMNAETPLLIIVDRSFDAAAPLVHERTYQCLFNDLMPLVDGFYEQTYTDRNGTPATRKCPIDELDPYWCEYRHQFFATCLTELPAKLNELLAANPSLAGGGSGGPQPPQKGGKLDDLGSAVRALPEFQEKQAKLSMHIDICTKLMDRYKQQHLMEVCDVEQDIATGAKPFRDLFELVRRWASDPSVPVNVRVRLILLFFAITDSRELTEAKRLQLIQDSGLANEAARCAKLDMFITRVGRLQQEDLKKKAKDAAPGRSGGSSVTSTLRSLRMKRKGPDASASGAAGSATSADGSEAPTGDAYRNQAYLILEAATTNTLSPTDFPALNGALSELPSAQGGAGEMASRRTLRAGLGRNNANSNVGGGDAGERGASLGRNRDADLVLDLGFEGKVKLNASQRIVLFVMGGVTYSESRAAYEVAKKTGREVIVGGTSLLSPEGFISCLANLR